MQTLELIKTKYSQLAIVVFTSIIFWVIFSAICFGTNPSDEGSGSIVAKLEFIIQCTTLLILYTFYREAKEKLDEKNNKILQYFIAINVWLFFVDLFFYIAAYANDSLLQKLSFVYFLLYYAPCIIFALSMVAFLSKILIRNILLANGFVERIIVLIIVDLIVFTFFLSSIQYAYTISSFKNILQIILLLTEFILFDIAIIGLIYAKNISAFLFLSGIIILVTGDFFLTYTYIAQTTTLFFMGELLWFLGLIFLMLTAFSIKENKHYFFNQWFRSDNAIRSRLGFGIFLTSISGFLITFVISYICKLIDKQVFLIFPPFIMLYSIIVVALSVLIAKSFESPFKKMENNINSLMIYNDKKIDNNFAIDEFVKLQDFLTNAFDVREEKDNVKKIFGDIAAKTAHDVASPIATMAVVIHTLKKTSIDNKKIDLLERSMINIKNIMGKLLESYRSLDADSKQVDQDSIIYDDLSQPRFIIFSKMIEKVIENKRIEWTSESCDLSFSVEESCKSVWTYLVPIELASTLSNILNNAYESLENKTRAIQITLTFEKNVNNQNFLLTVEDSGIGIPAEYIDAVKNGASLKHAGKGLGLINSIKFFESLHGNLSLESKLNLGTKVSISLPIISAPYYLPDTISYKQDCVFIVLDDDDTIGMLWLHILKMHNIKCEMFISVKEFDKWRNSNPEQENFILLCDYDLNDAQFTGIDIIKNYNLKQHAYLITSHAEKAWMQALVKENSIRLISKALIESLRLVRA
ncbi:MAG: hypothetical protein H0U73_12310 [Tatlockia sp.]|nr:hypothetical protein [Tatlockia sp.]